MSKSPTYAEWSIQPYCIGMKLRALRTQKRLTLSKLSNETGLSTALLSKLETDRMIPTLPTLATICRVYGVGISHFFDEPHHHALTITRKAHIETCSRGAGETRPVPLHFLAGEPRLRAQVVEMGQSGGEPLGEDQNRPTCGVVYVTHGRLRVNAGGMEETLETGDCVYVDSAMPLAWHADGEEPCRVLAVSLEPRS